MASWSFLSSGFYPLNLLTDWLIHNNDNNNRLSLQPLSEDYYSKEVPGSSMKPITHLLFIIISLLLFINILCLLQITVHFLHNFRLIKYLMVNVLHIVVLNSAWLLMWLRNERNGMDSTSAGGKEQGLPTFTLSKVDMSDRSWAQLQLAMYRTIKLPKLCTQ